MGAGVTGHTVYRKYHDWFTREFVIFPDKLRSPVIVTTKGMLSYHGFETHQKGWLTVLSII